MLSATSYTFRHQGAILREFNNHVQHALYETIALAPKVRYETLLLFNSLRMVP